MSNSSLDKEKGFTHVHGVDDISQAEDEAQIKARFASYGLGKLFEAGVEARGIERVPESERQSKHGIGLLLLWFSVNIVLTTIPIGMLAQPVFTLTFAHTVGTTIGFSIIGCLTVAFIATLGPRFGMRTMIITRYSYGYWGGTLISLLNVLTQLGFSVIAVILAGQVFHEVNHNMPLIVGVILIGVISGNVFSPHLLHWVMLFLSHTKTTILFTELSSYDFLHYYERFAWIVMSAIFIMVYALGGHAGYQPGLQNAHEDPAGRLRAADILSFGGIIFSSCAGWAPVAADFNCRLPSNTPPAKIFILTFFGLFTPILFIVLLGAALMTVPKYLEVYLSDDAAGVLKAVAGVAGRQHFSTILNNFLAILGYWVAFWIVIVAEEHFIFRRKDGMLGGYDLRVYDSPTSYVVFSFRLFMLNLSPPSLASRLPVGAAAVFASLCAIAGAVVSMAQVWYIGPIARKLGPFGGDMGFEFAASFAAIIYPPLRYLEIRRFGR
ncbi:hypothetical protein Clacol_000011 [Clathrus columnatus]|uniref:Uncharacterized protein n=1 Tax=Clathrus columnatus TaxID=1419009 RepID=A0AAV4ZY33_9AGAM|nr:hypothetical protein Clacol_000011 [Clathrus columnatus]